MTKHRRRWKKLPTEARKAQQELREKVRQITKKVCPAHNLRLREDMGQLRVGTKAAGNLLQNRKYKEFPE